MEGLMLAAAFTGLCRASVHRDHCMLYLRLLMVVSMTTALPPSEDWPLLDSNLPKQSTGEVPHSTSSPSALSPSSFKASEQSSDVHRTLPPLPAVEQLEASQKYHSDAIDTVFGSTIMPPLSFFPDPEYLSAPALSSSSESTDGNEVSSGVLSRLSRDVNPLVPLNVPSFSETVTSGVQLAKPSSGSSTPALNISSTRLLSTELASSEEPPFPPPQLQLQTETAVISVPAPALSVEPSTRTINVANLVPSHDLNMQNDVFPGVHLLNPSHALFGNHYMTSSAEPTMGPPEDFFPTNTMDMDYGSGDYLETMSFMGSEVDDYSLVTNLPSDMYDFEDSNSESYDTSFPTRVVMPLSTRHLESPIPVPTSVVSSIYVTTSPNLTSSITHNPTSILNVTNNTVPNAVVNTKMTTSLYTLTSSIPNIVTHIPIYTTSVLAIQPTAVQSLPIPPTESPSLNFSSLANDSSESESGWPDITIEPTDVLLPDMNSLEYYTIQLTKGNESLTEQRGNKTTSKHLPLVPVSTTPITATSTYTVDPSHMLTMLYGEQLQPVDNSSWPEESSTDLSGYDPFNNTMLDLSEVRPSLTNTTLPFLDSSVTLTPSMDSSTSSWNQTWTQSDQSTTESVTSIRATSNSSSTLFIPPNTSELPDVIQWFDNATSPETLLPTPTLISHGITPTLNVTAMPTDPTFNRTFIYPVTEMADEGITGTPSDRPFTELTDDELTTFSSNTEATTLVYNNETTGTTPGTITTYTIMTDEPFNATSLPATTNEASVTTLKSTPLTTTVREYLCNITKPDTYLVRVGFPPGSTAGYAKAKVREILKAEFNRSVELQVVKAPPDFVFRAVSGPVVYTAISVMNALRQSTRTSRSILSVSPISPVPGLQYHVHSVLQFVPSHIDVNVCTFSEHIERGLTLAFAEVRRRLKDSMNFTVHVLNITMSPVGKNQRQPSGPVDITFVIRDARGYILGSEISSLLRQLSVVEFSYYLGYPVQQIAEPFHYPELNTTQLLRSSWVRTVLLGVMEQRVSDRIFQAKMERRLALLLGEGLGTGRRFKRATSIGNNSVQIVQTTRLAGPDNPLDMIYFVEGPSGERLPAVTTANLLNRLDVQRAAIVLGYRVQGILAQPVEKLASSPSETENTNTWIIIGVVVPVLVVVLIISILYWKLCRTDKLEFQPDTMSTVQQRQKLQAPSVKGFDFAKLHLGQHSKDDLMVIQEPLPLPVATKEPSAAETAEASTPKSRGSSTKASRNSQQRKGRISPSDGDSVGTDPSSDKESPKENPRLPGDSKQPRKMATNGLNGPPPLNGIDDQVSSASIFEHVDRISRSADPPNKRFSSKIQLIAMQPMPALPLSNPAATDKTAENAKINKEIQVALRQKSEIEHHRNKIRLRAKRKGHYDFPAMDDLIDGLADPKEQDRIYQKAQMQIDKILDPDIHMPPLYTEPKKSGRERRSPRQRKKQQMNGDLTDADRDRLITTDSDGTYKKYPGVNNIAYVSDPDQGPEPQSPSPTDDVFLGPISPPPGHAPPPPPYLPPQPSIEEARQQMHSLLDDAFALVSPTSQGSNAGITLPGVGISPGPAAPSSPPSRGPRPWGPSYPALSPFPGRYTEMGLPPSTVQSLLQRQGLGSGYPPGDGLVGEQLQSEVLYNSRGTYMEELPSSVRPRPVGGTTGAQLHHLTQVGLSGRMGEGRQPGNLNCGPYHEEDFNRPANRDPTSRNGMREPTAPPAHLNSIGMGYPPSAPPEESSPPNHSSASLIKAIREELMRLSQKQAAVTGYHS
ncbi:UPF0606 protein KIAA1549 isoform X2 [Astyanax mexicanus]|uniref:UPF0606 protein KIAA1549 isoform X2 n=1 Tax=Astyanax mexicanus TaxID=7994 RepID=UPI0020CB5A88|nr:UPF0606 protein KIAA1549 isoform X2 [Astyanax mexicanus]